MKPIDLLEVDRLARKRFGKNAAEMLKGLSIGALIAKDPPGVVARCVGLIMQDLPRLPREVPTVVIPDFDARRLEVPAWLRPADPVQAHFAKLEDTRPDLFN